MTQGKDKNISSRSSRSLSRDGTDTGETKGSTGETICFVAAHSGGHMIPCATIASKLAPDSKILFITLDHKLERDILAKYNFINTIKYLELPKFPYQKVWLYPKFIYKLIQTVL